MISFLIIFLVYCSIFVEGTPPREHSPEPPLLKGLICSGADMIRRKLVGGDTPDRASRMSAHNKILLSRQEKRALRSLKLVEKVESIGLENIIQGHHQPVGISPLAMGVRSRTASPMTQLTSLKNIPQHSQQSHNSRNDDPYALDRDTITNIISMNMNSMHNAPGSHLLSKGMSHDRLSDISTEGSTTSSITNRNDSDDSALFSIKSQQVTAAATANSPAKVAKGSASTDQSRAGPGHKSSSDIRIKQMQRQKSRRGLINNAGGQRPDLGTVGGGRRDSTAKTRHGSISQAVADQSDDELSLASSSIAPQSTQSMTQMFVGSISSLFFGRKGGLL